VAYALWRRRRGFDLDGRVVFISGGSRGLGFALAREFLRQGARVALCARDAAQLDRAAAKLEGPVMTVPADLTAPGAAEKAIAQVRGQWQHVDVLVHVAGVMNVGPWQQATAEQFHYAMDLHCWAALQLARAVTPEMIARGEGRIVTISSIGGIVPVPHMLPYTTSKFALRGLSLGLATELRRHGVRVTCVCPFLMRTGSQEQVEVTGQYEREFAWFTALGLIPGFSESASRAARSIVRACRRGDPQVTLWLPGKLAALAQGIAPSTTTALAGMMARALPKSPSATPQPARAGRASYSPATARVLAPLVRLAGEDLNQNVAAS
jgi:NAD(P)-dependent dehydrogenase (short-subunit alcohol dehydrogenase family)